MAAICGDAPVSVAAEFAAPGPVWPFWFRALELRLTLSASCAFCVGLEAVRTGLTQSVHVGPGVEKARALTELIALTSADLWRSLSP